MILCSVGIALALFGVVLTYYSSVRVLGDASSALNVTALIGVADRLDPNVLKLAFLFILVGYGTKVGLVPMHTWLPDAYTEAPAPVAAMLAGVLETVAVYTVLRSKALVDQALRLSSPVICCSRSGSCRLWWPRCSFSYSTIISGCLPIRASSTWGWPCSVLE